MRGLCLARVQWVVWRRECYTATLGFRRTRAPRRHPLTRCLRSVGRIETDRCRLRSLNAALLFARSAPEALRPRRSSPAQPRSCRRPVTDR